MTESTEIETVEKPGRLRTLLGKRYVRFALYALGPPKVRARFTTLMP